MCQDVRMVVNPADQLVMVIKAPPETQLQVSEPSVVRCWSRETHALATSSSSSCHPQAFICLAFTLIFTLYCMSHLPL